MEIIWNIGIRRHWNNQNTQLQLKDFIANSIFNVKDKILQISCMAHKGKSFPSDKAQEY